MGVKEFAPIAFLCFLLSACSHKERLTAPKIETFAISPDPLPNKLIGTWVRTTSLRTFDYKPEEWVSEQPDSISKKRIEINAGKTYFSNHIPCIGCDVEWKNDTLYIQHQEGYYKFPVIALNDTLLHLKTKTTEPAYSLPNTGLFDFVVEEKYQKIK
jgi:hypothetical protein